jgi:hypothetical protein
MVKFAFEYMGQKCPKKMVFLSGRAREGQIGYMGQIRPKKGLN